MTKKKNKENIKNLFIATPSQLEGL